MTGAKLLWRKKVNGVFGGSFLDVIGERIVYRSSDRHYEITALSGAGRLEWRREFEDGGARMYFCYAGALYCDGPYARRISVRDGAILAEKAYGPEVNIRPPLSGGPVYYRKDPGTLMGLDPEDLSIRWEWADPEEEYTAHEGQLCRYTKSGEMDFVDLRTREVRRAQGPPRPALAGLHVHQGDLWCEFYISAGECLGIDTRTGEVVWRHADNRGHMLNAFVGGVAYSGLEGLWAYDLKTGRVLWRQSFGEPARRLSCLPTVHEGRIYLGTMDGTIWVLEARTGEVLLSHPVGVEPNPVRPMSGNRIVVGSFYEILCLEAS